MLNFNYIEAFFGIKDAIITKIENHLDKPVIDIHLEIKKDIHECPRCKELTETVHDYRIQSIKGPPLVISLSCFTIAKDAIGVMSAAKDFMKLILLFLGITECLQV